MGSKRCRVRVPAPNHQRQSTEKSSNFSKGSFRRANHSIFCVPFCVLISFMYSIRTKFSLVRYLSIHEIGFLRVLLGGHINTADILQYIPMINDDLTACINSASNESLMALLNNMVQTSGDLRNRIEPRYRHDQCWTDLLNCLLLDGFSVEDNRLVSIDPNIEGQEPVEDEFIRELNASSLSDVDDIKDLLNRSADDFRSTPPDYNGCLSKARIAIETLAKGMALHRQATHPAQYNPSSWGSVLGYLRTSGLITENEEKGLAGVYGFVSAGSHRHVGLSEMEMARLGRNLVASMCYFLIKLHYNP